MLWNPNDFHPLALAVLEAHAGKVLPLNASEFQPQGLPPELLTTPPEKLFPQARDARAALSGLLLLAGDWDRSHRVSQTIATRDGNYWHAIAHRIEPDCANAAYWFDRVGEHPIFPALRKASAALVRSSKINWQAKENWDTTLFTNWCDEARRLPGSEEYRLACAVQQAECDYLFRWCALKTNDL